MYGNADKSLVVDKLGRISGKEMSFRLSGNEAQPESKELFLDEDEEEKGSKDKKEEDVGKEGLKDIDDDVVAD